jgi:hypothetical protein
MKPGLKRFLASLFLLLLLAGLALDGRLAVANPRAF